MNDINDYLAGVTFRSNPNLRPAGVTISYTDEMLEELVKCKQDPIYFIENYIYIIHVDKGLVQFKLYEYQKEMIRAYHQNRKVLSMLFRQGGKTQTSAAFICWFILFNDNKNCAVLANKMAQAREVVYRIETAYENLPKWMQQGVKTWNKGSIELENGSRVFCAATSASGVRGQSISMLYLDELAHVQNNVAEEFFTSVFPTLSSGKETKILISSTPNGFNMFHRLWNEAVQGKNGFLTQRFNWWDHPDRDQEWADEQKAVLGELKYTQEVLCSFLGSSRTLLNTDTQARLSAASPIHWYKDSTYEGLKIYQNPVKDRKYTMTVDVSRGRHLDYSTFMVFDVTEYPHRIVASYRNNQIAPLMYAAIIHKVAIQYNEAYTLVEINDIGAQVAEELFYTFEYSELYWTKGGERLGQKGADPYPGIRTTKKTKRTGCANLKDIIEKQQLIVDDEEAIKEFSTFIQSNGGSYEADEGFHDDMVMCLVLYAWLVTQAWFIDAFDRNIRDSMYSQIVSDMENDMIVGEYSNGLEWIEEETPEAAGLRVNW